VVVLQEFSSGILGCGRTFAVPHQINLLTAPSSSLLVTLAFSLSCLILFPPNLLNLPNSNYFALSLLMLLALLPPKSLTQYLEYLRVDVFSHLPCIAPI
jgi:hypothetical protein